MKARRTAVLAVMAVVATSLSATATERGVAAPPERADLVVAKVGTPPATVGPGTSFSLSATVANTGPAAAKPSSLQLYLSKDRSRGTDDIAGGTVAVSALQPRKKKTVSGTVAVPRKASGRYWVVACADAGKKVAEVKESNNCRTSESQVDVNADIHATLSGTLTFLETAQRTDPATGRTVTVERTGSVDVAFAVDGDPADPTFASKDSRYDWDGSVVTHREDSDCVEHKDRQESGSGVLKYSGDPFEDQIRGEITKTDLSGIRVVVRMVAGWTETETHTGRGDFPCDAFSKTTTGSGLRLSDIELESVSATDEVIRYEVVGWLGDGGTTSDWNKVEGELTLDLR